MKRFTSYILYTLLLSAIVCACSDDLDIRQSYEYSVETLPLPKSLKKGEKVALEFSVIREGYYSKTAYKFRYFQSEGEGVLTDSYGRTISKNRFQNILSDDFVLYYQSECEEQQQLDFVFEDNFGQRVVYTIAFSNKKVEKPDEQPQPKPDDETGDLPDGSEEGTPDDTPDDTGEDVPDNTPEGEGDATGDLPDGSDEGTPDDTPDDTGEDVPDNTPEGEGDTTGGLPDDVEEGLPDNTPDETGISNENGEKEI